MIQEVCLPEISEGLETAEVLQVVVKVGDFIKTDDPIAELETDKATFDAPSSAAGMVTEILIEAGQKVKVGQVLIKVDTEAKVGDKPPAAAAPVKPEAVPIEEKTAAPVKAPEPAAAPALKATATAPSAPSGTVSAAPAIRHLANELGININQVHGTGPDGNITEEDVKNHAKSLIAGGSTGVSAPAGGSAVESRDLPDFSQWGPIKREKITTIRKRISETLSYAWRTIPHVTQHDTADITLLEEFRHQYGPKVKEAGGKLTATSILLKVIASALKEFPLFNSSFDAAQQEIVFKQYYNVSVAIDTDRGLLVPTIRDVDKKSLKQLSIELTDLSVRTRDNKVTPEEMVGGNFTISNLGGIGGTGFTPILFWPQTAILGVSRSSVQQVYRDGKFEARLMMPLSLSYDHRIIDGVAGLRFLRWVIESLENPFQLALEER